MKSLNFNRKFKKMLIKGKKTTTLRKGYSKDILPGDIIELKVDSKPIGVAKVTKVRHLKLRDLTEEDIKKDGFKTKEELMKILRYFYGKKINDDTNFTQIEFEILKIISK